MKPLQTVKLLVAISCALLAAASGFALPATGDEHWDPQFGPVGANDVLGAIIISGNKVYIGGQHTAAGNRRSSAISAFDGTNWLALNNGINGDPLNTFVFALAKDQKYVYAGGNFTNADNSASKTVARWDGTNWSAMGAGLPGYVFAFKLVGTNLYAGGILVGANGTNYNCLAQWNGSSWTQLPGDFGGSLPVIYALESDGTNIYVGGVFNGIGAVTATNVARWNGSSWSALGPGIGVSGSTVRTLLLQGNTLYAGGAFTNASAAYTNMAVWNGSTWSAWANANRIVRDLVADGTYLYAGGEFTTIASVSAARIARWDGVNWSTLGAGLQGFGVAAVPGVYKMTFDTNGWLYAAGNFNAVDGVGASYVARWDGNTWSALGGKASKGLTHFIGNVSSLLPSGGNLYAGGIFTEAGELVVNSIASWDGTNWSALGGGLTGTYTTGVAPNARGLAIIGSDLYVGGNFTSAGGSPANGIARWDGNFWWPLGNGADATVRALATDGSYLYAGGSFTNMDGMSSPGFAVWAGFWYSYGGVSGGSRVVNTIAVDGGRIYVGGNFTSIGGTAANNIAYWDGVQWNAIGTGMNNSVSSLAVNNSILYAGGTFTTAGGVTVNRLAKWDGANWSALGSGIFGTSSSSTVSAFAFRGPEVYIGGSFTNAGGVITFGPAKWNGTTWSSLGSGLTTSPGSPTINALAFVGNDLYVGGGFIFAGDKPSMFIAHWNDQTNFYPAPHPKLINTAWRTNRQFQFRLAGTSGERYIIQGSTNLTNWAPLLTNTATLYDFTDATVTNFPSRVYRAVLTP